MTVQTPPPNWQSPPPAAPQPTSSNGLAVAGFVLSLLGVLGSWIPVVNIIAILLGVLGGILAAIGLAKSKRAGSGKGLAIAGLILGVVAVVLAVVINVAFFGAVDDAVKDTDDAPTSTVDASSGSEGGSSTSASPSEKSEEDTFVDGVLTTADIKIAITGHDVIPPGQRGNKYGDKPIIRFTYDTTNLSGAQTDPSSAWIFAFNAYQDNDPNSENELDLAITLDDSPYDDTAQENIKKGGTVTNQMSYELDDLETPVDLKASGFVNDYGTVTYNLK